MKWADWIQSHGLIYVSRLLQRATVELLLVLFWPHVYRAEAESIPCFSLEPIKWHSPSPSAQVGPELWKRWARPWLKARVVKSGWRFPNDFFGCRQGRNALLAAFALFTRQQQQLLGFGGVTVHQPVGMHTTSATEINGYFRTGARRRRRIATRTAFTE